MRILIIGGGGREHALAWKLKQSTLVEQIYVLPGNIGMKSIAELVDMSTDDLEKVADFAEQEKIDLTVVGPEAFLAAGIVDIFEKRNLKIFGPSQAAAQIESSKAFAKNLMNKYNIPTAYYKVCSDVNSAKEYIKEKGAPIVIKADGLAAGKGVVVAMTEDEAYSAIDRIMSGDEFGLSGSKVVIEEFLEGEEATILAFTDGETIVPMISSQDHKRAYDNDEGPNTGGMGTYAPAPVVTDEINNECLEKVLKPVIFAMKKEGCKYKGCLYAGIMVTKEGVKVVEFNARFGDPETQVVLPLLDSDLASIMLACIDERLDKEEIVWKQSSSVCVVMASGGYPGEYKTEFEIKGLDNAGIKKDCIVFHAGTKNKSGKVVTAGGRVLGVTAVAENIKSAREKAYECLDKISFEKAHYRKDIAWRALNR